MGLRRLLYWAVAALLVSACSLAGGSNASTSQPEAGGEEGPTPWEQFGDEYELANVITDQPRFEAIFNGAYLDFEQCDEAYAAAAEGLRKYQEALEADWPDFGGANTRPGLEYDFWVARFLAGTQWLEEKSCPGAMDFIQVG